MKDITKDDILDAGQELEEIEEINEKENKKDRFVFLHLNVFKELISLSNELNSFSPLILYEALLFHRNLKTGICFPSQECLSKETGLHRTTIMRNLKILQDAGFIGVVHKGKQKVNHYIFPKENLNFNPDVYKWQANSKRAKTKAAEFEKIKRDQEIDNEEDEVVDW